MQFHVNPGDDLPIYRQLVRQIVDAIAGGHMVAGEKLPSHRDLAARLVIAPLTVKKAYDELERERLIVTQRGRGTFVTDRLPEVDPAQNRERLRESAQRLLSQAALSGVPFADVLALLVLTLLATVLSMPYLFLLPMFTRDIFLVDVSIFGRLASLPLIGSLLLALGESSARQGLLISVSGLGALAGSLVVASMSSRKRGLIFLLSLLLTAVCLVAFSITGSYLLALIIFVTMGLGQAGRLALSNTLLLSNTDDIHQGRVMSVYMMNWGITMVGVFFVSILADRVGVQLAVGGCAGLLAVITLYYLFLTSRIRRLN